MKILNTGFNNFILFLKDIYRSLRLHKVLYSIADFFGKVDKETVRIDGGLGSQIIGYMQYVSLKKDNPNINCDVSFFQHPESHPMFFSDVTFRSWQLDYYNISLDQLFVSSSNQKKKWMSSDLNDKAEQLFFFLSNGFKQEDWQNLFPISSDTINALREFGIELHSIYTAIHIRRGDFLKFSSLVIGDKQFVEFLDVAKPLITAKVFIISDDVFDDSLKAEFATILSHCDIEYISGGDQLVVHALMRNSQILVTSNSMYSLSAALIQRKGGCAILPKQFFGDDFSSHNMAINALSRWTFLTEKSKPSFNSSLKL